MYNEIIEILNAHRSRGPDLAMRREDVLRLLNKQIWGDEITDRKMRREVQVGGTICKCEKGYYLPRPDHTKEDVQYCVDYLKKKIYPLWKYIKDLEGHYLTGDQLDLGFFAEVGNDAN